MSCHRETEGRRRSDQSVVFFNLREHSYGQGVENKNADEREGSHICLDLVLEHLKIVTPYRLGRRSDSRTRPLEVILEDRAQRKSFWITLKASQAKHAQDSRMSL